MFNEEKRENLHRKSYKIIKTLMSLFSCRGDRDELSQFCLAIFRKKWIWDFETYIRYIR